MSEQRAEPIELELGADGVYSPGAPRAKKRRKRAAAPPAMARTADPAAELERAAPYMRVDKLALGALDLFLGSEPVYQSAVRPIAAGLIARTLSPRRIERHLARLERRLCR